MCLNTESPPLLLLLLLLLFRILSEWLRSSVTLTPEEEGGHKDSRCTNVSCK